MDSKCGNCKYFKYSRDIFGRCTNNKSKVLNKDTKTALSKPCSKWENDGRDNIELLFTDKDKLVLDKLLDKLEKQFPNKLNILRAKSIRHLLEDNDKLKEEVLKR